MRTLASEWREFREAKRGQARQGTEAGKPCGARRPAGEGRGVKEGTPSTVARCRKLPPTPRTDTGRSARPVAVGYAGWHCRTVSCPGCAGSRNRPQRPRTHSPATPPAGTTAPTSSPWPRPCGASSWDTPGRTRRPGAEVARPARTRVGPGCHRRVAGRPTRPGRSPESVGGRGSARGRSLQLRSVVGLPHPEAAARLGLSGRMSGPGSGAPSKRAGQ